MKPAGLQPNTIEVYSQATRRIGNYCDCRVENLTTGQLLNYFNYLLEDRSWNVVNRLLIFVKAQGV
ncbi:phage integrase N-terminal SAM-like domain-containing protein [Desulfobacter postgatei]|uniref:phage integrase N-terminal SAM-like domain-containing protein n=1 Tax=Desulfobacter postgatei TaxID=2293 RepID=UPI000311116A|nr:phage integrase N-terminal SAM-like domain-containing protein [Desulfobacter postgatei]